MHSQRTAFGIMALTTTPSMLPRFAGCAPSSACGFPWSRSTRWRSSAFGIGEFFRDVALAEREAGRPFVVMTAHGGASLVLWKWANQPLECEFDFIRVAC